jgi:hypothetical protein
MKALLGNAVALLCSRLPLKTVDVSYLRGPDRLVNTKSVCCKYLIPFSYHLVFYFSILRRWKLQIRELN